MESLDGFIQASGAVRTESLLAALADRARRSGVPVRASIGTPYVNTIPADQQPAYPGDRQIERRIKSLVRWNAMAMVVRANRDDGRHRRPHLDLRLGRDALRGRLQPLLPRHATPAATATSSTSRATPRPASTRARSSRAGSSERAAAELPPRAARRGGGLSSYPHPWLMPDFWEFPTVSMGLGPIMAIYQARFNRYLRGPRPQADTATRKVWAFLGDGETDEPESLGAITLASREKLDNLIFVINCNLQRLDGPVRGNGQIIQELEAAFRGAGWNVIKVIWGASGIRCSRSDHDGLLVQAHGRDRRRPVPEVHRRVRRLHPRALLGHRPAAARRWSSTCPTTQLQQAAPRRPRSGQGLHRLQGRRRAPRARRRVILARTIKGYGLGEAGEGKNITHQQKKLNEEELRDVPRPLRHPDLRRRRSPTRRSTGPPTTAPRSTYLRERRAALGGSVPQRRVRAEPLRAAAADVVRGVPHRHRRPQGRRRRWCSCACCRSCCATRTIGKLRRADRARRGAHLRHGGALPPGRHLLARRPALRAGRHGHAALLQGSDGRPDSRGGHHRGRLDVVVHRRRHRLRDARRQHDPVLHLLLDVRLPAHRRPDLGRRRHARAAASCSAAPPAARRSPARGCSTRTATATCSPSPCPNLRRLRPGVRLRARRDHRGRHPADVRRRRGHLLLPDRDERAVRACRRCPTASRDGILQGLYLLHAAPTSRRRRRARSCSAAARSCPRRIKAQELLAERYGVAADVWSVDAATASCYRDALACERWNLLHPASRRACPTSRACLADAPRRRSSPRPTT